MYGGNESEGNGMDGVVDVGVHVEQHFCYLWGDWGILHIGFLVGNCEAEGQEFIFSTDDHVG